MFTPNCRILWGAPKLIELEIFSWPGVPCKQKPQPCAINKRNYHKPLDCRHVEIPVIPTSTCFLLFWFILGNVTCEQFSGSKPILGWAQTSVYQCAMLLDLWTCEIALLEKTKSGTDDFWSENSDLQSVCFGLCKIPFQRLLLCIHMDARAINYIYSINITLYLLEFFSLLFNLRKKCHALLCS